MKSDYSKSAKHQHKRPQLALKNLCHSSNLKNIRYIYSSLTNPHQTPIKLLDLFNDLLFYQPGPKKIFTFCRGQRNSSLSTWVLLFPLSLYELYAKHRLIYIYIYIYIYVCVCVCVCMYIYIYIYIYIHFQKWENVFPILKNFCQNMNF